MLVGNDITETLQMRVDIGLREATFQHPMFGSRTIKFGSSKKINDLNVSLAVMGIPIESDLLS